MVRGLSDFKSKYSFKEDLQTPKEVNVCYGNYDGMELFIILAGEKMMQFRTALESNAQDATEKVVARLSEEGKVKDVTINENSVTFAPVVAPESITMEEMEEMLDYVKGAFSEEGMRLGGCTCCGSQSFQTHFVSIDGTPVITCDTCLNEFRSTYKDAVDQYKNRPSRYIRGILGGIVGTLLGVALWIIIAKLGYVAALVGYVIVIGAYKGYMFMKGKPTKLAGILIMLISVVMMCVAQYLYMGIEFMSVLKEFGVTDVNMIDILFAGLPELFIIDPEFVSAFWQDTAFGLVFLVLGGFQIFKSFFDGSHKVREDIVREL
ncbi:MAG: hypothetical protein ACRDDX_06330 [Cellulosilyticaceae bacterium]